MDGRLKSVLASQNVPEGISGTQASALEPGQPFHRDGLLVLKQYPVLALVVWAQSFLVGMLVYEFIIAVSNSGRFKVADTRIVLLGSATHWIQQHVVWLDPANGAGPIWPMLAVILAMLPWLVLLNWSWAIMCGVMCKQKFSWTWLASGALGIFPVRLVSRWFFSKWAFWKEDARFIRSAEARLLQYTFVYRLVNRLSAEEINSRWFSVLESRLRDVTDSYFSFLHVPGRISLGIYGLAYAALSLSAWYLFPVRPDFVFLCWMIYLTLNRSLLGLATFRWLEDPTAPSAPLGSWKLRAIGILAFSVAMSALCIVSSEMIGRKTLTDVDLTAPVFEEDIEEFLIRVRSGREAKQKGSANLSIYGCWDSAWRLLYVGGIDGQQNADRVARVTHNTKGMQLSYLPGISMADIEPRNHPENPCHWIRWGLENESLVQIGGEQAESWR